MADGNTINYIALKLDDQSKQHLIKIVKDLFGSKYSKFYCDHVTLAYGKYQVNEFDDSLFGKKIQLDLNSIVYDDNCVAMIVNKDQLKDVKVNNEYPHITMAVSYGIKPVYSNQLISDYFSGRNESNLLMLDNNVELTTIVTPIKYNNGK